VRGGESERREGREQQSASERERFENLNEKAV